jgi:2-oxoglutarate dehydrogenase E1 component
MDKFLFLNAVHTKQIAEMNEQYLKDPDVVEPSWRSFFKGYDLANLDFKKQEILSNFI